MTEIFDSQAFPLLVPSFLMGVYYILASQALSFGVRFWREKEWCGIALEGV